MLVHDVERLEGEERTEEFEDREVVVYCDPVERGGESGVLGGES
jgi:hypothetical protein